MKKIFFVCLMAIGAVSYAQKLVYLDESKDIEERVEDALKRMTLAEKIDVIHAQSKFSSAGVKRLGMPDFWTDDGPHGVRPDVLWDEWEQAGQSNDSCVAFPALTCLAATWQPAFSYMYGYALGEEALYRGKSMILGPGINIYRTPLGGRNFEYMGEDPYLTSRMVVPYVQGLQSVGVASCVKHYCLNNDEEYRHQVNVIVSDRALHEIYLPGFEAAIKEGKAWGIMGAYNLYKNEHNCHNQYTLNKILKQDWGFDGVVVSDWGGAHDLDQAVKNGLDMEFGTWTNGLSEGASNAYDMYYLSKQYQKAIVEGKYTTKELDEKVRRVLRTFFRTTMNKQKPYGFLCSEQHYQTARMVAHEGIVLLQNEGNVLPILPELHPEGMKILVVGENAIKMMTVGGGSSSLKAQHEISPLQGLKMRIEASDFPSKGRVSLDYARGYVGDTSGNYNGVTTGQDLKDDRSPEALIAEAVEKAKTADYVIIFGGLNKSNYQDCEGHDRKTMDLPYNQDKLITSIAVVNKNTVYVNISGNAVSMPWRKQVPAIVQGWFLGSESGIALADVLLGRNNPSGHLPFTWYESLDQCGAHSFGEAAFPGIWREGKKIIDEEYKEGIYVGYRWTDKQKLKPAFAFGHGLSYTTFKISNLRATLNDTTDGNMTFKVDITNTGNCLGSDVVQLYITDVKCSVDRPVKELKAFKKVMLKPGETQTVTLTTDKRALSFWDEQTNDWKAEPGEFIAQVGDASDKLTCKVKFRLVEY
ncbi:MAG: glycoside hydrolase family 3 C-terminal domain-containing protein [Bacteroidaceae bacterium]|nr:glycoside hydrolase family 3 C-terminal domain-containing protein [Bacteroidaceae bacterium]